MALGMRYAEPHRVFFMSTSSDSIFLPSLMKLFQYMLCAIAALSFMGCQAPLYDAYKREDVLAIKRGLAAGEDPYATRPSNWWWKVPTIPFTVTVDISRSCLGIATLGLYPELEYLIRGSRQWPFLTDYVGDYGSISLAEAVLKRCESYYRPEFFSDKDVAIMVALLESGKVTDPKLRDWCFYCAICRNDAALARTCLNKGYRMVPNVNEKTPLMLAIEAGSGDVARVLMQYGASIHETTRSYSCQFVAQESGHLDLYRSLGGQIVDQPVAPRITCSTCKGAGYEYDECSYCGGDGKVTSGGSVSPGMVRDNYASMVRGTDVYRIEAVYEFYEDLCGRCSGGRVLSSRPCPKCNGVGSFSRYDPIPQ